MDGDAQRRVQDVYRKIERERNIIQGAQNMRQKTTNAEVRQRLESNIRESQRNIAYLETKMNELHIKHRKSQQRQSANGQSYEYGQPPPIPPKDELSSSRDRTPSPGSFYANMPGPHVPKARPNYTKLDLVKYETPHVGPRIQLMLQQLAFKLSLEKQYKEGVEKMAKLYSMEGDRWNRADAENKRIESNRKISLLKQALKRYEDLHVEVDDSKDEDDDSVNAPNIRRPLSGRLQIAVSAVKDIDHAATAKSHRSPETFVVIKVEDVTRARTKASKTDRWTDEFEIEVDKANEIEFTVYDKQSDHFVPIGLLWIRISDIAEELRRKKIEQEIAGSGWVRADRTQDESPMGGRWDYPQSPEMSQPFRSGGRLVGADDSESSISGISAWFTLEPVGRIQLTLNFVKQSHGKRPYESHGLGRQGAIRQRKEEIHEMYGHKFVQQQFYNIMRCALCGEFLKYSAGMQCSDCKYTCHKKCYLKVVTKCISKTTSEMDLEEEKINHRIPHRFEQLTNIGANWCCHCGYILPLGKKNARKCSECGLTCHTQCAHLVPDFCGMSMEMAHQIIGEMKTVKHSRPSPSVTSATMRERTLREPKRKPLPPQAGQRVSTPTSPGTGTPPEVPGDVPQPPPFRHGGDDRPSAVSRASYGSEGTNAAKTAYRASMDQQRSPPYRTSSAAAAAAAMQNRPDPYTTGKRAPAPPQHRVQRPSSSDQQLRGPLLQTGMVGKATPSPPPSPSSYSARDVAVGETAPLATRPISTDAPVLPPIRASESQKSLASNLVRRKIGLDDFNFLAVLGKGNFGKVMLAEAKATKRLYAIKVLKKEFIIENDEVESTRSEKRVFLVANKEQHPFLLNLYACFQTETRIYFVMDYISGGDLMLHIQREQFSPRRAQFYAAEVCLALKYFHDNGIIYRDLKLDNILLSMDGHIKIADYGLCKEDMGYTHTTSTFCGTPEFMAPEILLEQRYGRAVDWWAFGVLIYQMLLGQSPFRGEDEDEIFDAVLTDEPLYPIHMPRDSVSILQKLLTREPEKRLGSGPEDAAEIMAHPFFRGIQWDEIYRKRVEPPFVPRIGSDTDTSNFDPEFTNEIPVLTPVHSVLTQAMQEQFRGFSYMHPNAS